MGLPPELIEAIEAFTAKKKELEARRRDLETKAAQGGVKGNAAANELAQIDAADKTTMNRQEVQLTQFVILLTSQKVTLDAARRKAMKTSSDVALDKKKKEEEAARKKAEDEARARMAERKKAFEAQGASSGGGGVHQDVSTILRGFVVS